MSAIYNNLPLTESTYIIMQDSDRYDDREFGSRAEDAKAHALRVLLNA